ncbi:hypothetical protein HMPREF5505_1079 [Lactobacillus delbrueckii subsp. lactis DSM 20072]|nr:hypothetical protein HMPREF5505_1079 [Lactobacillus delbrueckii subsp. lactis DSM 20072]
MSTGFRYFLFRVSARLACLTRQQILVYSLFSKGQINLFIRFTL